MAAHPAAVTAPLSKGTFGLDSPDVLIADLLHRANVTALAACAELDRKSLYRYATLKANPNGEHRPLPFALAPVLEIATGRRDLVDWHAAQLGGLFVPRPRAVDGPAGVLDQVAALTAEFADVQHEAARALLDGDITATEALTIDRELTDLQRYAETLRQLVIARAGRKGLAKATAR